LRRGWFILTKEQKFPWRLPSAQSVLKEIVTPLAELPQMAGGQRVRIAGVISRLTKIITKSNQPMIFATVEDMGGKVEVLVFPAVLIKTSELWSDGGSLVIEGKLSAN